MHAGVTLNEGVESFKHISFRELKECVEIRMVPLSWRETFSEFKAILQPPLRSLQALNSTESSSKGDLHFAYGGFKVFGWDEDLH